MRLNLSVIGALIGAGLLALPAPALAAAAASGAAGNSLMAHVGSDAFVGENALLIQVQYRGHRRDGRRHDRHRGGGDDGAGVAAGILGGVLLGAIIANEAQRNRSVDYCVRRYRSYDPRSGTYLGNDGYRHRCP